jgi:hypothetical protein
MKRSLFFFLAAVSLLGCSTLDRQKLTDPSIRKTLDPLTLDIGYDAYLLRADLNRATHSETRSVTLSGSGGSPYTTTETVVVPNDYHYIAVVLGNGIIFDFNHNLCLDLARFYGFKDAENFKITLQAKGLLGAPTTFEKDEKKFAQTNKTLFGGRREVVFSDKAVDIVEPGLFAGKPRITINSDSVEYTPEGFPGLGPIRISKPDDATVVFPGFWAQAEFKKLDAGRIILGKALEVVHHGTSIDITYRSLFGWDTTYSFFRTESGCFFYDTQSFQGVEVRRENDRILVFLNGVVEETYRIDSIAGQEPRKP